MCGNGPSETERQTNLGGGSGTKLLESRFAELRVGVRGQDMVHCTNAAHVQRPWRKQWTKNLNFKVGIQLNF